MPDPCVPFWTGLNNAAEDLSDCVLDTGGAFDPGNYAGRLLYYHHAEDARLYALGGEDVWTLIKSVSVPLPGTASTFSASQFVRATPNGCWVLSRQTNDDYWIGFFDKELNLGFNTTYLAADPDKPTRILGNNGDQVVCRIDNTNTLLFDTQGNAAQTVFASNYAFLTPAPNGEFWFYTPLTDTFVRVSSAGAILETRPYAATYRNYPLTDVSRLDQTKAYLLNETAPDTFDLVAVDAAGETVVGNYFNESNDFSYLEATAFNYPQSGLVNYFMMGNSPVNLSTGAVSSPGKTVLDGGSLGDSGGHITGDVIWVRDIGTKTFHYLDVVSGDNGVIATYASSANWYSSKGTGLFMHPAVDSSELYVYEHSEGQSFRISDLLPAITFDSATSQEHAFDISPDTNIAPLADPNNAVGLTVLAAEDFEGQALSIPFTGTWEVVSTSPQEGTKCYASADIGDNQQSTAEFTLAFDRPSRLKFYYRVSTEATFDSLSVYVNGGFPVISASGEVPWTLYESDILPAGTVTLELTYSRDGSLGSGENKCFVDNIIIEGF